MYADELQKLSAGRIVGSGGGSGAPESSPAPAAASAPAPAAAAAAAAALRLADLGTAQAVPRGPGTFFHFVNSPMKPQDGSNCTFDPMEKTPPNAPLPLPETPPQALPLPQPLPKSEEYQQVSQPKPLPGLERQPLIRPEPQLVSEVQSVPQPKREPLSEVLPLPLEAPLSPVGRYAPPGALASTEAASVPSVTSSGTCPPCRCSCSEKTAQFVPLL